MKFKTIVLALLLIIAVSMVYGCSGSTSSNTGTQTPTTSAPTAAPTVKLPTATPAPAASSVGLSKSNPAPIGTQVSYKSTGYKAYSADMKLVQVIRGDDAFNKLRDSYISAPKDGMEYLLADFSFKLTDYGDGSYNVNPYSFGAVDSSGKVHDITYMIVVPKSLGDSISSDLYKGGSTEGWVLFEVPKNDKVLLVYDRNTYSGTGGVWFST